MQRRAQTFLQAVDPASNQNKVAVLVGGTKGIGAGIATQLVRHGVGYVYLVGRGLTDDVKSVIEAATPTGLKTLVQHVKGDLSSIAGCKALVNALITRLEGKKLDILLLSQKGMPNGEIEEVGDNGLSAMFMVQTVSRFAVPYLLVQRNVLAPKAKVMAILDPGDSLDDLDLDDICFQDPKYKSWSKAAMFSSKIHRDSTLVDAIVEELRIRYDITGFHLQPGLVQHEGFDYAYFPWPIKGLVMLGMWTIANTPETYSVLPTSLLLSPTADAEINRKDEVTRCGPKYDQINIAAWAKDKQHRGEMWKWLVKIVEEQ